MREEPEKSGGGIVEKSQEGIHNSPSLFSVLNSEIFKILSNFLKHLF